MEEVTEAHRWKGRGRMKCSQKCNRTPGDEQYIGKEAKREKNMTEVHRKGA